MNYDPLGRHAAGRELGFCSGFLKQIGHHWISFAVGQSWWRLGHMGGAYSLLFHPQDLYTMVFRS